MRMTGAGRERALLFDEKREMFRAGAVIVNLGLRNLTCTSFCSIVDRKLRTVRLSFRIRVWQPSNPSGLGRTVATAR